MMKLYIKRPRIFYVCSFGGCGSWMLVQYLSQFGTVHHVHSRYPPEFLTTIDNEWFTARKLTSEEIACTTVIYIYRNPVAALASVTRRFPLEDHLRNIECSRPAATLEDAALEGDVFGLHEFFVNYVRPVKRNYRIFCVKYEMFFKNLTAFNTLLKLQPTVLPVLKETATAPTNPLQSVYAPLQAKMDALPFIWMN